MSSKRTKRKATFEGGLCFIELTLGYTFWCPEEAYWRVLEYWGKPLDSINWYARVGMKDRLVCDPRPQGCWGPEPRRVHYGLRQRQIADVICEAYNGPAPPGYTVDHIHHHTLYGGIEELRWASPEQQQENRRPWLKELREAAA